MSQKKTNTQTQTTQSTLTAFLTSPEMIQLVRDVTVAGKTEGSKLRTSTATHLHSGLTRCKALLTSAKAALTQLQQQSATSPAVNYDTPTIMRKLGTEQFEVWQHLNGVIETPDTNIHVQAYNTDLC